MAAGNPEFRGKRLARPYKPTPISIQGEGQGTAGMDGNATNPAPVPQQLICSDMMQRQMPHLLPQRCKIKGFHFVACTRAKLSLSARKTHGGMVCFFFKQVKQSVIT